MSRREPGQTDRSAAAPVCKLAEAQSKEDGDNILRKIKQQRHIRSEDRLYISPKREDYKSTVVRISREHKHPDEEVRYFEQGTGYLDVRDPSDQWLRIQVYPGNLIVLPPDVYHRFYPVTDQASMQALFSRPYVIVRYCASPLSGQ
ncbi:hypothetical protein HPB47_014350 [Ixodes persulcatus]|uniref:Uncharacterized protein n=1 Tax=Ixodes persulcatus TaxID=34615 RepID=A0AC60QZT8_IXOPE|nr:hypothetical protein HPB47_014350 [Ixodes persulcatus]